LTNNLDKILEFTPTWISTNDLFRKIGGNKSLFLQNIKKAEDDGYIEIKQDGRKKLLKRNDNADSEMSFSSIMAVMEWNQKDELDKIKELPTIGYLTLTNEGIELLDHVQDQVDRAYIVMIRMNYQAKLRMITQKTANERIKRLQDYIDKIMLVLTNEYNHNLIKEYFQNHVKRLEFKI